MKLHHSVFLPAAGVWQLVAQGIHYHIRFTRMVKDLANIILDHVQPPTLPHIQVRLVHDTSQTIVIRVNGISDLILIMSPNIKGIHHYP